VLAITTFDLTSLVFSCVPMSAGVGFLLWVGILITAQAFEQDPSSANHSWAVALGLVPCLAGWALQLVESTVTAAQRLETDHNALAAAASAGEVGNGGDSSSSSSSPPQVVTLLGVLNALDEAGVHPFGMVALSQGYLLTSIILASTMVHIVDRRFEKAAVWMLIAAGLSWIGMIHGYELTTGGVAALIGPPSPDRWGGDFTSVYCVSFVMMAFFHLRDGGDTGYLQLKGRAGAALEAVGTRTCNTLLACLAVCNRTNGNRTNGNRTNGNRANGGCFSGVGGNGHDDGDAAGNDDAKKDTANSKQPLFPRNSHGNPGIRGGSDGERTGGTELQFETYGSTGVAASSFGAGGDN